MPRRFPLFAAVFAATATACTHATVAHGPVPSVVSTTSTTEPDYSAIGLPIVPGRTTTSIDNSPGTSHLSGVVTGPDGAAVPSANVHVERLVGDAVLTADLVTAVDGTWHLDNVQGGRYRVRAWRAPDLALVDPSIFFLNAGDTRSVPLRLGAYTGTGVVSSLAPNPPLVDGPANLVVQVRSMSVDNNGVVRAVPQPGMQVQLFVAGPMAVLTTNPVTTDSGGDSFWRVECSSTGATSLTVVVGGASSYPLTSPPCSEPPPPPTTTTQPASVTTTTLTSTATTKKPRR